MNYQNITIALSVEDELLQPLYRWGSAFDFSEVKTIQLIHIIKKHVAPIEFGLMESPDEATLREMIPTFKKFLENEGQKIIPSSFKGQINYEVKSDFHPNEKIIEYLQETKTELLVLSTRGKHGLDGFFHSSFTDYMTKFAPCDLFVVRPQAKVNS